MKEFGQWYSEEVERLAEVCSEKPVEETEIGTVSKDNMDGVPGWEYEKVGYNHWWTYVGE